MKIYKIAQLRTVRLDDIYSEDELHDTTEMMYNYIDEGDFHKDFQIRELMPIQAKSIKTPAGDMSIIEAFQDFATEDQKRLVQQKADNFDDSRVVLMCNNTVIDGNHQLIAGIIADKPIKYISLSD